MLPTDTQVRDSNTMPTTATTSKRKTALTWLTIILTALVIALLVRTFVFQTFYIPSSSMYPTLQIGDRIVVNKLSVEFGTIHTGDIVVFKAPPAVSFCSDTGAADFVKRVIGVPGDTLTSRGNTIYINGKALKETWQHSKQLGKAIGNVTVGANQYFVMGDNYADSCDSRYWGTVPRSNIIGKVFVRVWPLSRLGFL